jgi:hypothetical protein
VTNTSPPNNDWGQSNKELQEQLAQLIEEVCEFRAKNAHLIEEVCEFQAESAERLKFKYHTRRLNNRIRRLIQESGKLRRDRSPHYEGCLQQLWLYFFENLCAVNRKGYPRIEIPFCKANNIMARLNLRLRGCIQDAWETPPPINGDGAGNPFDQLPAPKSIPLPSAAFPPFLLKPIRAAVEADESGELCRCQLENHPDANCKVLILRKLPLEVEWEALADELGILLSSLSPFYDQRCRPLLEKISEQQLILYIRAKIEADESGELRECHSEKYPAVTAQVLILRRLPPEVKWKELSNEFKVPISMLSTFYQRQCQPRLKAICEQLLNQWQPEEEL